MIQCWLIRFLTSYPINHLPLTPPALLEHRQGGVVWLPFIVDTLRVIDSKHIVVKSSADLLFADAARRWLWRVHLSPGWREGQRVRVCLIYGMRFLGTLADCHGVIKLVVH